MTDAARPRLRAGLLSLPPELPALLGFAVLATPTVISGIRRSWPDEQDQYGLLTLALGTWLLVRERGAGFGLAQPGRPLLSAALLALGAELYVVACIADNYTSQCFAVAWVGFSLAYALYGPVWMRALWFPLGFLLLALPPPLGLTFKIASVLRLLISMLTVTVLRLCHLDAVRDGLNIQIDQYTLSIAEACSGMNSLISLSALGLLYLHLRRDPGPLYLLVFTPFLLLAAIAGNFARVLALVLSTHVFGDDFTQSIVHDALGLITFLVALLAVVALDEAVHASQKIEVRRGGRRTSRS